MKKMEVDYGLCIITGALLIPGLEILSKEVLSKVVKLFRKHSVGCRSDALG